MIEILYGGNKGIRYRVINEQTGNVLVFSDHEVAIHYDLHGKIPLEREDDFPEVHYPIMEDNAELDFIGGVLAPCKPCFCNGFYTMFEYESDGGSGWVVTTMAKRVMAIFALREQAMKYIHDKECRT